MLTGDTRVETFENVDAIGSNNSVQQYREHDSNKSKSSDGEIGEWDSQHGEVEVYDKTGKHHKGAYDPETGQKKKEGDPKRKTEK
ncbi:hypothetical protein FACS1894178_8050 [Bacteroidia bacterium]|nr:hypothetical protein FACS1894178_8050 [Bacteroidia bacterium]